MSRDGVIAPAVAVLHSRPTGRMMAPAFSNLARSFFALLTFASRPALGWLERSRPMHAIPLRRWPAFLLLVPLLLAACAPSAPFRFRATYSLSAAASDVSVWFHWEQDGTNPLGTCGVNVVGVGLPPISAGSTLVGFSNYYDPGTNPFPCRLSSDEVYRGAVRFDLSAIQKLKPDFVESANLNYVVSQSVFCSSAGGRCVTDRRNCVAEALVGTVDLRGKTHVPGDLPPGESYRFGPSGDVTSVVREWINGTRPNFGFVLKGADESYGTNNSECQSILTGFTLTVKVLKR
jgi:hypothetical protein